MPAAGSGTKRGDAKSNEGTSGKNLGGGGTGSGGFGTGGMPKSLLDSKYPGASKKKNKSFDLSLKNVGTLVSNAMDIANPAGAALKAGLGMAGVPGFDSAPLSGFEGQGPDVPSTGAGYADSGAKDDRMTPAEKLAQQKSVLNKTKSKSKLSKGFTLLAGAGGTLLGS